ncbi:Beta-lactamase [Janthinobacterium sp. CG23_2]|nr:Beta-lactamase [Janthinobacterium sp. CG23_2]CUU32588.1 Beta-lactamase [Janthinobacterium sp. CG23_2]
MERGRLALDAPLHTIAPEIAFTNPWKQTDPVRVVHLLEHTTGWPDISTRALSKNEAGWSTLQGITFSSPAFISRWKPGMFPVYNNAGPAVAGYAIEKVTGLAFDDYMRTSVLKPMGMESADFSLTSDLASRMAKSYGPDGVPTPYQHIVLKPAGSLVVSAHELAQLARFYIGRGKVDGRRILTPESVARIERGESNLGARLGFSNAYGLGNAPIADSGITFRGHNGSIDSFTSVLGYTLRNGSGYVWFSAIAASVGKTEMGIAQVLAPRRRFIRAREASAPHKLWRILPRLDGGAGVGQGDFQPTHRRPWITRCAAPVARAVDATLMRPRLPFPTHGSAVNYGF